MQEPQIVGPEPEEEKILTADEFHKTKIGKENLTWGEIMCAFARYHCENQREAIDKAMRDKLLEGDLKPDLDLIQEAYPLDEKIIPI